MAVGLRGGWPATLHSVAGATGAYTRPTFRGSHGSRLRGVESSNSPPTATPAPRGRGHQGLTCLIVASTWGNNRGHVWPAGPAWCWAAALSGKNWQSWQGWWAARRAKECCQSGTAAPLKSVLPAVRQGGGRWSLRLLTAPRFRVTQLTHQHILHKAHCSIIGLYDNQCPIAYHWPSRELASCRLRKVEATKKSFDADQIWEITQKYWMIWVDQLHVTLEWLFVNTFPPTYYCSNPTERDLHLQFFPHKSQFCIFPIPLRGKWAAGQCEY